MLCDGVTRATRAAKLCPGAVIAAELLGVLPNPVRAFAHCTGETTVSVVVQDELLESLAELRRALPSIRLGRSPSPTWRPWPEAAVPGAVWEAEDEELLKAVRWQLRQLSARPAAEETGSK